MKNLVKISMVLIVLMSIIVGGCEKDENKVESNYTIVDFKNDERLVEIVEIFENITKESPYKNDFNEKRFLDLKDSLSTVRTEIIRDYGETKILEYCDILKREKNNSKNAQNCCTRNPNGTVNNDCCSFWGLVKVAVTSIYCPDTTPDMYYDCVQNNVCNHCN